MDEPTIVAKVNEWLWALPVAFVTILWRTMNGKASGKQLDEHIIEDRQVHEQIVSEIRMTNRLISDTNVKVAELVGEMRGRNERDEK